MGAKNVSNRFRTSGGKWIVPKASDSQAPAETTTEDASKVVDGHAYFYLIFKPQQDC
jgi:hypothetical protein